MTEENDKQPPEEEVLDSDSQEASNPEKRAKASKIDIAEANRRMYQSLVDRGVF